jgi:hypothetical protein
MKPYIYLRALRLAEHTVFCVAEGQKTYTDSTMGSRRQLPFSSGQQVKRSVMTAFLESLGQPEAPITFNFELSRDRKVKNAEPHSPCDPDFPDQLLGGWMRAKTGETTIKRRSPLSISAMHPLHPLLADVSKENITFDRSQNVSQHNIEIRDAAGKSIKLEEALALIGSSMRDLTPRTWIPDFVTATGLFIYDVAIDLRRLFCVSLQKLEPEINADTEKKLRDAGWKQVKNAFGDCLICPKKKRDTIIPALAEALLEWRITSNQARTFSPQATLAVALSDKANAIAGAIRAELDEESTWAKATPRLDRNAGAELFIALPASGYIVGEKGSSTALDDARNGLVKRLNAFDYENQIRKTDTTQ